ncbi:hypothetical protein SCFA_1600002 [anaerobic digester metagenome]|uniref:Uncharacterized protein n=1 Tax=anaerobic digester metagenome TaxID=1263854 RepID=A0A485LVV0_9ZZZZ
MGLASSLWWSLNQCLRDRSHAGKGEFPAYGRAGSFQEGLMLMGVDLNYGTKRPFKEDVKKAC